MRFFSVLMIGIIFCSSAWAVTPADILDHLATSSDDNNSIISIDDDGIATVTKTTIQDLSHDDIIDAFRDEDFITREQFAYMLDLLTDDLETVRDIDRCHFRDYETAQSALGLVAVNNLCHKRIVRGTYQKKYHYQAKLTEAEAVTMIIRTLYLDEYETLRRAEIHTTPWQRHRPYYQKARDHDILIDNLTPYGSLATLSPATALSLLQHNFGSINDSLERNPLSTLIYQTIHDDERGHVVRWIRDKQGETLSIDDDSITVSLDPYRSMLDDEDIFVSKSCDEHLDCITKIEFAIDREDDRRRYCGTMTYVVDHPYEKEVEEDFCLER